MAKKVGRPKIELKDLPDKWEESIINLSKQGASIVELAVELDISRDTLYEMIKRDVVFSDTIKKCKRYCESWWMKQGRVNLENKDFSATLFYMNMKNRFGWADKQEIKQEQKVEATIDYSKLDAGTIKDIITKLGSN